MSVHLPQQTAAPLPCLLSYCNFCSFSCFHALSSTIRLNFLWIVQFIRVALCIACAKPSVTLFLCH